MTEPEYVFVKDKGWVLQIVDSVTDVIGKWRVTIFNCEPEKGDYYVRKYNYDIEYDIYQLMLRLKDPGYLYYFLKDTADAISLKYGDIVESRKVFKITLEKV